jgi:hypothetical protein
LNDGRAGGTDPASALNSTAPLIINLEATWTSWDGARVAHVVVRLSIR